MIAANGEASTGRTFAGRFLWGVFALVLILHVVALFTESINWDEWALLARVTDSLRSGVLDGGGRPGFATLVLIPFARECTDAIAVLRSARLLWTGFTIGYVVAFWIVLRQVLERSPHARGAAALGVGMLVLVPAFLRWSVQVRADQPALFFAMWAGVALLASRKNVAWALVAGLLAGVGFLFSQKAAYLAALVGALAVGKLILSREFSWKREPVRALLCGLGGIGVLLAFKLVPSQLAPASTLAGQVQGGLGTFEFYRLTLGYSQYILMLPTLVPHLLMVALILIGGVLQRRVQSRLHLQVAMMVLCLGFVVVLFHAARFEYFWMTLGVFFAAAAAIGLAPALELVRTERSRQFLVGSLWALLVAASLPYSLSMLRDTQAVQRESLAFIDRNFPADAQGFSPERALFCREGAEPFPTYFSQHIFWLFSGADSVANTEALLKEFREKPVSFVVETYRLDQFPERVRDLLTSSYVPYRASVMIPGHTFRGRANAHRTLDTFVPGTYRWMSSGQGAAPLEVDGRVLHPGDTITLQRGPHSARWSGSGTGFLVLAVSDPPDVAEESFYAPVRPVAAIFSGVPHPGLDR